MSYICLLQFDFTLNSTLKLIFERVPKTWAAWWWLLQALPCRAVNSELRHPEQRR